jgi:UDP-glucose:(heptosyl)LPS alpha-1,3-glucosyltransferase
VLFAGEEWPADVWCGELCRVGGNSPRAFAEALEAMQPRTRCDFLFSLERVLRCDAYRAGDGVHAAWLERRASFEPAWKPWFRRFSRKHRELLHLERELFAQGGAGMIIANSRMVQAEITSRFGYPAEQIHVVYNGVPPAEAPTGAREQVRQELGLPASANVLLFAGSGWERKGLRFAIEALEQARGCEPILLVAGRGSRRGLPASERVRFLGPVADLRRYHAAADVFVLPTIYEPFSNACLEAAAAGLPVITTRHNGFAEVIDPGPEGEVLEDPRDIAALAQAITRWSAAELRAKAAPRLRELGRRYSIEANVLATLALIEAAGGTAEP